jgi:hypothetical protein
MSKAKYTSLLCPDEKVTAEQLTSDRGILAFQRAVDRLSRRSFLGGLTGATALAVSAGFFEMPRAFAQTTTTPSVADVLNFALNLEYLEANLYTIVTTGNPVPASLNGGTAPTIQNSPGKLTLDAPTMALFQALAADEQNHINDLRTALTQMGATPISSPTINYAPASKGAITTQAQLLATARQFTEVGNSAYQGGAMLLVSAPAVLRVAAQILGAEGQHLGAINYQCITQNVAASFTTNAMAHVDALDVPPSPTQYFSVETATTATAAVPAGVPPYRTPQQCLGIVYGVSTGSTTTPPTGVTSGGFFPNGANGNVKST